MAYPDRKSERNATMVLLKSIVRLTERRANRGIKENNWEVMKVDRLVKEFCQSAESH